MNNKRTYKTRLTNNEIMTYKELRKQQQARFNKLPMKAAFGDKQFEDMMKATGLYSKIILTPPTAKGVSFWQRRRV